MPDARKACLAQQFRDFGGAPGAATAHGVQVKAKISGADRLRAGRAGERLGDQQHPAGRENRADRPQQVQHLGIIVIMQNPHKGDEIGAGWKWVIGKIAAEHARAWRQPSLPEAACSDGGHLRQIKKLQAGSGGFERDLAQKTASSATGSEISA